MKHRMLAFLLATGTLGLAGCVDEAPAPTGPSALGPPSFSTAAADGGRYLALIKGSELDFRAAVAEAGGTVAFAHAPTGVALVDGLTQAAAAALSRSDKVADLLPDAEFAVDLPADAITAEIEGEGVASQSNPTTASRYPWQWNMRSIGADRAWAAGKLGSSSITVAILDTGIDYDAPDMSGLVDLSRSASFIPFDNRVTATYFASRHPITDYHGHGTNVATQVSSKAAALAGVTSQTTLIGVKVLGANGRSSGGSVLAGLLWSADQGANVANMSLGGAFLRSFNGPFIGYINRVMQYVQRKGVLVVVAAGNSAADLDRNLVPNRSGEVIHYPNFYSTYCDAPHVLCVSAAGPTVWGGDADLAAYYTNFGRSAISVAGPGGNAGAVATSWPWGFGRASWVWSYCSKTRLNGFTAEGAPVLAGCQAGNRISGSIGTSQATPHVAGLAALLMAETGTLSPQQIKARILQSSDDRGAPGTDPYFGRGRINVARALGL